MDRPPYVVNVDGGTVTAMVNDFAARLGMAPPSIQLATPKVSFLPVMVTKAQVTVTPAALASLPQKAMEFAILYGLVLQSVQSRGATVRKFLVMIVSVLVGVAVGRAVGGTARPLVAVGVSYISYFLFTALLVTLRQKSSGKAAYRRLLEINPSLEGARLYKQVTDEYDLTGDVPARQTKPPGQYVELNRLEATAREMNITTGR